jgi:hypothetical protein
MHVDIRQIVAELKSEQQRLDHAIKAIQEIGAWSGASGSKTARSGFISIPGGRKRRLSAAARKRISDAQKRRWAKIRRAA